VEGNSRWIQVVLVLGTVTGISTCLWRIASGSPTANEALLLSLVLTGLSIAASWIVSQYYSETSFNKNLRVFALKAAEKVTNLSNEFDRLSLFLQQELKEPEYESSGEALLAKDLRIESAIHIINTLKSVNDKSLSDWQGIIDEEISAKREEQEAREETLREIMERFDDLQHSRFDEHNQEAEQERLQSELASIRNQLRLMTAQVGGVPVSQLNRPHKKAPIEKRCPTCGNLMQYIQKSKPGTLKGVSCKACGARWISTVADGDVVLAPRVPIREKVICPGCDSASTVDLDPLAGTSTDTVCPNCSQPFRVSRSVTGIRTHANGHVQKMNVFGSDHPPILDEILLEKISSLMGKQPWPEGQSGRTAVSLGISKAEVRTGVEELIRRGVFLRQFEGELYAPVTPPSQGPTLPEIARSSQGS